MPMFIISYDLNKQKNYPKLWEELKRLGCVRALESVWIGKLTGTADTVIKHLTQYVDGDDSLIVSEAKSETTALKRPFEGAREFISQRA